MTQFNVHGKDVWCLTVSEVAKVLGEKARNIRNWINKGIMPDATVKVKMHSPALGHCLKRYYMDFQVEILYSWYKRVKGPLAIRRPTEEDIAELKETWNTETIKFQNISTLTPN